MAGILTACRHDGAEARDIAAIERELCPCAVGTGRWAVQRVPSTSRLGGGRASDEENFMQSAFLEFGSTSIKFYLLEESRIREQVKIPWDLGLEVFQGRPISRETIAACLSSLEDLRQRYPHVRLDRGISVGTAALREAKNAEEFQAALRQRFGLRFHAIEGGLEAFLLESGFKELVERYPTVVFDLGGGSVEFVEFRSPTRTKKLSLPIGAIRLHCQVASFHDRAAYIHAARRKLNGSFPALLEPFSTHEILGTGGTVRALANVLRKNRFDLADVSRLIVSPERIAQAELEPHRERLLLPGLLIVEFLFRRLDLRSVTYTEARTKEAESSGQHLRALTSAPSLNGQTERSA